MKKILYIIGVLLALASCTDEDAAMQQGVTTQTFNVAISEPDDAPQTKAVVTMNRYLLEMYEGDLSAEPVRMESTSGTFNVTMKKEVDYVCLFWADNGTSAYDAASLKAVKQTDNTQPGTAAYWARVTVSSNNFNGNITLRRAVAELSFIDKKGLTGTDNTLKITYPYASAVMNLGDGTVEYNTTGTPVVHTLTHLEQPTSSAQPFATDYILAPADAGKLTGLKLQLNSEEEKTIPEAVVQANYKTKITGEYETPLPSMSITIDTRKNPSNASDATFILPLNATLSGYSLIVDWGDGQTETFPDGTTLMQTNMTHTYAQAGKYIVTISSTQRDGTQTQMPQFSFYNYYSNVNANSKKLVSFNTPLLNMGFSLSSCFRNCTSLTGIPVGLFDNNPSATDFSYCFYGCTGLTGIPAGLFDKNTQVTNFSACFNECTGLTGAIPEGLFDKNTEVKDFNACFYNCTKLTGEIPKGLFDNNTKVTDFSACFYNCAELTGAIPEGLFDNNTLVTTFESCFYGCTGLTGVIPEGLFKTNTLVTTFYSCFSDCTGLTGAIPGKLFEKNALVTSFQSCFYKCTGLEGTIPEGLFTANTDVTTFGSCFSGCTKLSGAIPGQLFSANTLVTNFSYCFFNCAGLEGTIPEGLFTANTKVTNFESCFYGCKKLTGAIPGQLFTANTAVKSFESCFYGCTELTGTIPEGLFTANTAVTTFSACFVNCAKLTGTIPGKLFEKNIAVMTFASCFYGCTGLTEIPQGLFDSNTQVTNFSHCFSKCTGLTETIPGGLFNNNTKVTNFSYCFNECSELTGAIPQGLFDNNTKVTTFGYCFYKCSKLTGEIPEGLFAKNTAATIFDYCFFQCHNLIPTANIFCDETETDNMKTRFDGKNMYFKNCFSSCGFNQERQGTLPQLWNYTMGANSQYTLCFAGTQATNTSTVPDDWK
ncbi:BspA family leucine-rich repeat surface protein [Bacteroides sp.]|uniref:BspA family leucine-rich repeat surface protein n=1 Tax=Bacteroides sp. TaxID=29523 RepID=UPI003AB58F58